MFLITLHGFQRSSASFRVRIALNLKACRVPDRHSRPEPGGASSASLSDDQSTGPAAGLEEGSRILTQSLAIIGIWARFPSLPLLPPDPAGAAGARAVPGDRRGYACVGLDASRRLSQAATGHDDAQVRAWQHHWIGQSFDALETLLSRDPSTGEFSHGDRPSLADIALMPQAHTAGLQRPGVRGMADDLPHLRRLPAPAGLRAGPPRSCVEPDSPG